MIIIEYRTINHCPATNGRFLYMLTEVDGRERNCLVDVCLINGLED